MKRAFPSIIAAIVCGSITATAAGDPLAFWSTNHPPAARAPMDIRTDKGRRGARKADAATREAVYREGERFGVSRAETDYHMARESGWTVAATNPTSTARGLFQPIRGSHAAIIGRPLSYAEHRRLAFDPIHNARVGFAHIRACKDAMPGASPHRLWRECHVKGHANVGTSIHAARAHYQRVVERAGTLAYFDPRPAVTNTSFLKLASAPSVFAPTAMTQNFQARW